MRVRRSQKKETAKIPAWVLEVDKMVVEVRNGKVLYVDLRTPQGDGWYWWTCSRPPLPFGPYTSKEAAIEEAAFASDEPIKVIQRDDAEIGMSADEIQPIRTDGLTTINVLDTAGELWVWDPTTWGN
jgi:hypothetical protein